MGVEKTKTGRPCKTCSSQMRAEIESLLVAGVSVSVVSRRFSLSPAGVYRHLSAHLSPVLRAVLRGTEGVSTGTLLQRIADVADSARQARISALENGATTTALRAGDAEIRAITVLSERFDLSDVDVIDQILEGELLARAVGNIARNNPTIAHSMIAELRASGADTLADALYTISQNSTNKEVSE